MLKTLLYFTLIASFFSCNKSDKPSPLNAKPVVSSISPLTGGYNTEITIKGKNFGSTPGSFAIKLNSKELPVQNWSDTSISIVLPERTGSGAIVLSTPEGDITGPTFNYIPKVYVCGQQSIGGQLQARYWINDVLRVISDNAEANCIWVEGNDVYVAGSLSFTIASREAVYWKNGLTRRLTTNNMPYGTALSICYAGGNLYSTGTAFDNTTSTNRAFIWKNEIPTVFTDGSVNVSASSICAVNNDIYVAGYTWGAVTNGLAWKNGTLYPIKFDNDRSVFNSIYATNSGDIYIAGSEFNGSRYVAKYWKNGVGVTLNSSASVSEAKSIYVSGSDVYVAGIIDIGNSSTDPVYWKNGVKVLLPKQGSSGVASSIQVLGEDVFVAGSDRMEGYDAALYWKNGVRTMLSDGSQKTIALSIFLQ